MSVSPSPGVWAAAAHRVAADLLARSVTADRWTIGARPVTQPGSGVQVTRTRGDGRWIYHTRVVGAEGSAAAIEAMADLMLGAAGLSRQPWYAEFRRGVSVEVEAPDGAEAARHQLAVAAITPRIERGWCQVCVRFRRSGRIVLPLVAAENAPPNSPEVAQPRLVPAEPSGDVLSVEGGRLRWDHVVAAGRVGLGPARVERLGIGLVRALGWDVAERTTYEREGLAFIGFTASPHEVEAFATAELG